MNAALLVMVRAMLDLVGRERAAALRSHAPGTDALTEVRSGLIALEARLTALAEAEAARRRPAVDADGVRALIRVRRLRPLRFGDPLAGHAGWDLLLELYAATLEGRAHGAVNLAEAAGVPPTTAARWLDRLEAQGLIARRPDPEDDRRVLIELTDPAARALHDYLSTAARVPMG